MRTVEIVSHCWRYSKCLTLQLSSLVRETPTKVQARITVFYNREDRPTARTLDWFAHHEVFTSGRVLLTCASQDLPQLLNRSIGRNEAAKLAAAEGVDLIWFADCDYWFGEGCLDALADVNLTAGKLFYPKRVLISRTHALGDSLWQQVTEPGIYPLPSGPDAWAVKRERFAIGGLQIVPGPVAAKYGYCDGDERELRPVTDGCWRRTHGDVKLRKTLGRGTPISVPELYRIRQTTEGFVDTATPLAEPGVMETLPPA